MKDVKTLKVVHNFTHVTERPHTTVDVQGGPKKVSHYHESSLKPAIKARFFINFDDKMSTRI